jgi:predicted nucleotidyltransferase
MTNSITIRPQDRNIVRDILEVGLQVPEKSIYVFGSRAIGTSKPAADLDLAIDIGHPLSHEQLSMLADAFEESDLQSVEPNFRLIIEKTMRAFPLK